MQDPTVHSDRDTGRAEVKETTCYMCACRCGIRVHLRDGQVRYIEGNPNHPLNKGVICAKGSSGIMKQVSPARLTKPLRRKANAKRGESQFEEISWDEAMSMLSRAAQEAARGGPEEVCAVHRSRPDAGPDRHVRQAVRHAQLCRPWRFLLGEHGRRHDLQHRRLVLGVRRAGPGALQAVHHDRHRRGPPLQSAQDRDLQVQAPRRALHLHQSRAQRLLRHRR